MQPVLVSLERVGIAFGRPTSAVEPVWLSVITTVPAARELPVFLAWVLSKNAPNAATADVPQTTSAATRTSARRPSLRRDIGVVLSGLAPDPSQLEDAEQQRRDDEEENPPDPAAGAVRDIADLRDLVLHVPEHAVVG